MWIPGAGGGAGGGGVTGPATSTDNAVVRWDGTGGNTAQDSAVTVSDTGEVAGATRLDVDNLRLDGNSVASTDANGPVVIDPAGTGRVCFGGTGASDPALHIVSSFAGGPALRCVTANFSAGAGLIGSVLAVPDDTTPAAIVDASGLRVASGALMAFSSTSSASGTKDAGLERATAGCIAPNNGSAGGSGSLLLREMASPPAAVANAVVFFAQDNGAGKTQLMAQFPTGAPQQVLIEP
jgi:hypothetical protein